MYKKLILSFSSLACLFFLVFLFYQLELPVFKNFFLNSDALYLPILFQNLFEQHGSLKDWYLTPAPYFFPDFFVFLPAYALGETISTQMAYYTFFQISLLGLFLYFFFKYALSLSDCAVTGCTLFATVALSGLALQYAFEPTPYTYLLISAFHYGCFLIEIVCLTQVLRFLNSPYGSTPVIALCALSFFMTCSDALFLAQYVLPMTVSLAITLIYCSELRSKKNGIQLLLPFGFSLIGFLIYPQFVAHPTRYPNQPGLSSIASNFHEMTVIFHDLFQTLPLITLFLVVFYVSLTFIVVIFLTQKGEVFIGIKKSPCLIFLSFFTLLSAVISILIMLLMTHFMPTSRYFIPIVSFPIVISIGYIAIALKKNAYLLMMGGVFSILGYLSFQAVHFYQSDRAPLVRYYPEEIACIDQSLAKYPLLRHGIAQYWDAKLIQAYSRKNLIMAQYEKNLHEDRWITSDQFYQAAYDFSVINTHVTNPTFTLSLEKIAQYNLPPLGEIHCGNYTVLIYSKNTLKTRPIVHPGDMASWRACELPFILGHPTKNGAIRAEHIKTTEFVTYGPYELLSAGLYQFEISYSNSKPNHKRAGTWDVVSIGAHQSKPVQKGIYWGTDGQMQHMKGTFNIFSEHPLTTIEIRTKAFPGKWFQVSQLTIKRLK